MYFFLFDNKGAEKMTQSNTNVVLFFLYGNDYDFIKFFFPFREKSKRKKKRQSRSVSWLVAFNGMSTYQDYCRSRG